MTDNEVTTDAMVRVRFDIAYDGTDFHGWASQKTPDIRTVQSTLEQALATVVRHRVRLTVAGRTDAGVHATGQVAHADISRDSLNTRSLGGDVGNLARRLARLLPADVRVLDTTEVSEAFDARFSAVSRSYRYRVCTDLRGPLPTRRVDTAWCPSPIDLGLLQSSADPFIGLHDFAAVSKYREGATTVRRLTEYSWRDVSTPLEPHTYEAAVTADAFTWSMVRSLVGACLSVAAGRRAPDFTAGLLQLRSRSPKVPVAPACGLTLVRVDYPPEDQWRSRAESTRGVRVLQGEEHRARGKGCPETNPYY